MSKEIKACASIGLPLQEFQAMDLALDLPLAPGIAESGKHSRLVASNTCDKTASSGTPLSIACSIQGSTAFAFLVRIS